jgi:hypothetical protein
MITAADVDLRDGDTFIRGNRRYKILTAYDVRPGRIAILMRCGAVIELDPATLVDA